MECKSKIYESPFGGLYAYRTIKLRPPTRKYSDLIFLRRLFFGNLQQKDAPMRPILLAAC
jgi:hypothetical protein